MSDQPQFPAPYYPQPQTWAPEPAPAEMPAHWVTAPAPEPAPKRSRLGLAAVGVLAAAAFGVAGYLLPHSAPAPAAGDQSAQVAACQSTVRAYTDQMLTWGRIGSNYVDALKSVAAGDYSDGTSTIRQNTALIQQQTADFTAQNDERDVCMSSGH